VEGKLKSKARIIKEKSFGAVVINEKQEFLLIKHKYGEHWDFPKGHKEGRESDQEAARREVHEETGLLIQLIDGFKEKSKYSPREDTEKTVTYYIGFSTGKVTVQEEEILEYAFLSYEEAMERITFKESRDILKTAKNFIDAFLNANED